MIRARGFGSLPWCRAGLIRRRGPGRGDGDEEPPARPVRRTADGLTSYLGGGGISFRGETRGGKSRDGERLWCPRAIPRRRCPAMATDEFSGGHEELLDGTYDQALGLVA